jgi:hypothetical protein
VFALAGVAFYGTGTLGWTSANEQLKIRFGDRLPL